MNRKQVQEQMGYTLEEMYCFETIMFAKSFKLHPKDIKRIQPIPTNQIAQEAVS